jgi:uncharacterized membrane protein (UPF0127 family)
MIFNKTKNKKIVSAAVIFKNVFSQFIGLRFKKRKTCLDKGFVFPIPKKIPFLVDMYFVNFSIDLIFIDKFNKVVEIKRNLKPKQHYHLKNFKATKLIELLPKYSKNIDLNDIIIINNV